MAEYKTVKLEAEDEFTEKRSKFIGYCKPITTEEQAMDFINKKRSLHWNATHNVYAYSLRNGQIKRYSDDGEPSGTAGVPTLDVLQKSGVTDTVIVVTRYFGGVLLGAGGLVRAYSHSAKIALDAGKIITMRECTLANVICNYNQYGKVSGLIPECGGVIDDSEFLDNVKLNFHITEEQLVALNKKLADATCGEITAIPTLKQYFEVE